MVGSLIAAAVAALIAADGAAPRRFEAVESHMGADFKIVFYTSDDATASRAFRAGFARIAALDLALSDYNPESELMRLCAKAGGPPVAVGDDLFAMLARSVAVAERSGGAFDPTIAPVVRLWRRARRERKLPDAPSLARARALVGFGKIALDPARKTVRLDPGVKLDLGGIAKGYASGEAVKAVKAAGVARVLVAGAGDIAAGDPPPDRPGWTVAVAGLGGPGADRPEGTLLLSHAAVSTSGDAEQYVVIDGVRYSHVVNPKTGLGLAERLSVTVIAPDGATADALDTAASILGPERGLALVAGFPGAEVLFVRRTPAGVERYESPGFAARLIPAAGAR